MKDYHDIPPDKPGLKALALRLIAQRESLEKEIELATAELRTLRAERDSYETEIDKLRFLIKQLQRSMFGRRSEKRDGDQINLGLEDLEQSIATAEAAREAAEAEANKDPVHRRSRAPAHRNRGALPSHLPREEIVIEPEQKTCPCCQGALHVIGEDTSEQLDIVPAQLKVRVIRRPRYGCRACEGAVVQAPAPPRPIDGGMATEALLAHVIVSKYADHLPLYRQAQIFARQGIDLDRSTLATWVGRAAWWLNLLYERLTFAILASPKIFSDDTVLPVLDPGRGRTKTGRLWSHGRDDRPWNGPLPPAVIYVYAENRAHAHPIAQLTKFNGILQVDAYQAYEQLVAKRIDGSVQLALCWAHSRRRFYDVGQATNSPIAAAALQRIGELYAIEARIRGLSAEQRRAVRKRKAVLSSRL